MILDVMPPDEWHYPVNNSAYTNTAAQLAVNLPADIHAYEAVSSEIKSARFDPGASADINIYVPFDSELQYHPEFDGYKLDSE